MANLFHQGNVTLLPLLSVNGASWVSLVLKGDAQLPLSRWRWSIQPRKFADVSRPQEVLNLASVLSATDWLIFCLLPSASLMNQRR